MTHAMRHSLFGDENFTATELARNCSKVLDRALENPITISRGREMFAISKRNDAARWIQTIQAATMAILYLQESVLASKGSEGQVSKWLLAFDANDLTEFQTELMDALRGVLEEREPPSEVEKVIFEWKETGLAIQSGALTEEMFRDHPSEGEPPLQHPDEVLAIPDRTA
jgi:hypothetical protein